MGKSTALRYFHMLYTIAGTDTRNNSRWFVYGRKPEEEA